ncbi:hypothetical protein [Treponema pedis]|uniref:hypothetical protein n=1 Tax=Treponema pedis TaxID=409322 RepID=UPI0004271D55|nr:hypothetical protein [Treponema pedis]
MEFNINKVYTAVNANEVPIESKCVFADTLGALSAKVEGKEIQNFITTLKRIYNDGSYDRFYNGDDLFCFAYLIELPKEPKYKPFSNMENLKKSAVKYKGFIKTKQGAQEGIIIGISFDYRAIIKTRWGVNYLTFEQLFESYIFDDGSPCGELVES